VRVCIQVDSLEVLGRALRQRALDIVVGESTILEGDESIDIFERLVPIKAYLFESSRLSWTLWSRAEWRLSNSIGDSFPAWP